MTKYIDNIELATEICCNCSMTFAMPSNYQKRRIDDHKIFFCPAGHQQHYTGKSAEQKLRDELERKAQMLEAEQARANKMQRQRDEATRAHMRMRTRVQNGVCPCCNRTFQNLLRHMQTEHADQPTVKSLRQAYGLSQANLAEEIGVNAMHVSLVERNFHVPKYAAERISGWVESQAAKEPK